MSVGLAGPSVATEQKFISVRLGIEAVQEARVAAAMAGKSLSEYITEVLLPIAKKDVEKGIAERERRERKSN